MAIITRTLQQMRQDVARKLGDIYTGTADTGSGTVGMLDSMLSTYPDSHFNGWELTALFGTPQSRMVTAFGKSGGTVTFAPAMSATIGNTTAYELHKHFTKLDYDEALNDAIRSVSDSALIDKVDDTIIYRKDLQAYPIPSGFVWLYDVQYDGNTARSMPEGFGSDYCDTDYSLGTSSISKLSQSFTVGATDIFVRGISLLLRIPNGYSTSRTMTAYLYSDSDNAPSALVATGTPTVATTYVDENYRWIYFAFPNDNRLTKSTRYHIVLSDDITTDAVRASWGGDADAGYAGEYANSYIAAWAAVTTSRCFRVYADQPAWTSLKPNQWDVVRSSTRTLYVNRSDIPDGAPLRLIGLQAPTEMAAETDNCPVNPTYVEAHALATLCASMIERNDNDPQAFALKARYYDEQAERLRGRLATRIPGNSRLVEVQ